VGKLLDITLKSAFLPGSGPRSLPWSCGSGRACGR